MEADGHLLHYFWSHEETTRMNLHVLYSLNLCSSLFTLSVMRIAKRIGGLKESWSSFREPITVVEDTRKSSLHLNQIVLSHSDRENSARVRTSYRSQPLPFPNPTLQILSRASSVSFFWLSPPQSQRLRTLDSLLCPLFPLSVLFLSSILSGLVFPLLRLIHIVRRFCKVGWVH